MYQMVSSVRPILWLLSNKMGDSMLLFLEFTSQRPLPSLYYIPYSQNHEVSDDPPLSDCTTSVRPSFA